MLGLMEDYKTEPGGKARLKERNPKWLNDDYVKFIRYGQHYIEKNGSGIVAFINPHGFLDNPTFRGMRWHLLKTYDKIYTIDLHGNSKKKETAPDGTKDENVFDIQQGVSINIFVKTGKKKADDLAKVYHYDLYGKRRFKYDFLNKHSLNTVSFKELPNVAPMYFMVPKDFRAKAKYDRGFSINELFPLSSVGIVTGKDALYIDEDKKRLMDKVKAHYGQVEEHLIRPISYRPFDTRYLYNNIKLIERNRFGVMKHFVNGENLGLVTVRRIKIGRHIGFFVTNNISDDALSGMSSSVICPLYLYPENNGQTSTDETQKREPNLDKAIVKKIAKGLRLDFTDEKEAIENTLENTFAPIDLLDYIYAVLHSPSYRTKYREFLKIDFPRIPYPKDRSIFWELVRLGGQIRQIHLFESAVLENYITQYPVRGDNTVDKPRYKDGKVYINDTQYFDNVLETAWTFYIGGYQPAQKWLKDRKEQKLEFEDILHYQKIIVALSETDNLMREIDKIDI